MSWKLYQAKMIRIRTDSMSSLASSEFSSGGASSVSSISVRDCTAKIKTLQQENFDLRLRIFLLEEKLGKQSQTLKQQLKTEDNQRPVNVRRFFSYQRPQSYEGETERQVTSEVSLTRNCILTFPANIVPAESPDLY